MTKATAAQPKAKPGMTLCLWPTYGGKHCALPAGHGGMHVMQTSDEIRKWWPNA